MKFVTEILVRFAHVDAAGIVFYPRYFEMLNQIVEDWFSEGLGLDFRTLLVDRYEGIPAVRIEADFHRPSRLGDRLRFELEVQALGRSTITLVVHGYLGTELRLSVRLIIVYVSSHSMKSIPLPDDLRNKIARFQKPDENQAV